MTAHFRRGLEELVIESPAELKNSGVDIRLNIVGFTLGGQKVQKTPGSSTTLRVTFKDSQLVLER